MTSRVPKARFGLTTKLSMVVTGAIVVLLTVLGVYFETFLQNSFLDNAHERMQHVFMRLSYNLKTIEDALRENTALVQTDESLRASIDLINNYQDKDNYNVFLIDEEKKSLALRLLSQVKLSLNSDIALYDQNEELIAYVSSAGDGFRLHYLSFAGGKAQVYSRAETDLAYQPSHEPLPPLFAVSHTVGSNEPERTAHPHITYNRWNDTIVVVGHLYLYDETTQRRVAYMRLSKQLDRAYFEALSANLDMALSHAFEPPTGIQGIGALSAVPEGDGLHIQVVGSNFVGAVRQATADTDVPIYYVAKMDKGRLDDALQRNRTQFLALIIVISVLTLLAMRLFIRHRIATPLDGLMEQISKIERQDYSVSQPVSTADELHTISVNINRLARAVHEREASLKDTQDDLRLEIADRQQAQIELMRRTEALERSNADLQQFAYIASHDLKEPLRSVGSFLQLLKKKYGEELNDEAKEYIDFAVDGAKRMDVLVGDLLSYTELVSPGKPYVPIVAKEVWGAVLASLKSRVEDTDAVVTFGNLPDFSADPGQTEQLFLNLLGNAMKYRKPGRRPEVHVEGWIENGEVHYTVRDNGIGIDPQYHQSIFVVFRRLHNREVYEGAGVGLAVCKRIIDRHGGRIWVESTQGEGSTFHFTLPLTEEEITGHAE